MIARFLKAWMPTSIYGRSTLILLVPVVTILLVVTVALVIIVALIFSRRLSQPILRLTQAADAISRGRMDTEIEGTERADEIGLLAAAIVRLRNSTRLALERLTRRSRKAD